ncbi:MAG: hypothetical protein EBX50_23045 [Chitinophagia bacterium]|nr:hypothetical protein [Chitinophagia bacterium]
MANFGNLSYGLFGGIAGVYGSFYDTTQQVATNPNQAYAMKLNNTVSTNGVSIQNNTLGNPTRIKVVEAGVYNIQFSAQLESIGGGSGTVDIWARVSENNVPDSNTHVTMPSSVTYLVASWNLFVTLQANQYVELMWATSNTNLVLFYDVANGVHPATPSLIVTINKVY